MKSIINALPVIRVKEKKTPYFKHLDESTCFDSFNACFSYLHAYVILHYVKIHNFYIKFT